MRNLSIYKLLAIIISIGFVVCSIIGEQTLMIVMLFSLYLVELIYAVRSIYKNIILLLFLVAFLTFLMGRLIMPLFINMSDYSNVFFSWMDFRPKTYYHVIVSLYLALLFMFFSYTITEAKVSYKLYPNFNPESPRLLFIRKWAKIVLWISFPFALLVVAEKIIYVMRYGYAGMLIEQVSVLPSFVVILSVLFEYMVYLFLATLPSKHEAKYIIILYVIYAITNIMGGDRGECILSLFVVIYYLFLRNRLYSGPVEWIGRKGIISMFLATPLAIMLLYSIAFIRTSSSVDNNTAGILIGGFFYQQGSSMNVIACAYEDEEQLPQGKLYSIGPIIDYFKINYLSRILFGTKPYKVGSQELAVKGNSLASAITYLENTKFYESGGGMGSSYIAEAYYDFGYIGIVLYSLLYGFVLASIPKWNTKNVWLSVISLVFLKFIMYAPRASATAFVAAAASVAFWPIALFILMVSYKYSPKKLWKTKSK